MHLISATETHMFWILFRSAAAAKGIYILYEAQAVRLQKSDGSLGLLRYA